MELNEANLISLLNELDVTSTNLDEILKELNIEMPVGTKIEKLLTSHYIDVPGYNENYTLMQFAACHGLKDFCEVLLNNKVDPNFSGGDKKNKGKLKRLLSGSSSNKKQTPNVEDKTNCREYPVLLAAKNGKHEILKLFKYHSLEKRETKSSTNIEKDQTDGERLISSSLSLVNFMVSSMDNCETALHIILEQPLLKEKRRTKTNATLDVDTVNYTESPKTHLQNISRDYKKCIKVLLDMDKFDGQSLHYGSYESQIRTIINEKDTKGNTALHYAASNWSTKVVTKLLSLGANASITNKRGDIPLSRISMKTLKDFMDKQCIMVKDFDPSDDDMEEDSDEDESYDKVAQDYNQTFMLKIGRCGEEDGNGMTFDYSFLAPPRAGRSDTTLPNASWENGNKNFDGETNVEKEDSKKFKPEMDLLWEMSQSKEHRPLITHPVINSYLWMKWKLMSKFFNRILRLEFLFLYCITWQIFDQFGGHEWNAKLLSLNLTKNSNMNKGFCEDQSHSIDWRSLAINSEIKTYGMIWYYAFLGIFAVQIILMARDYLSNHVKDLSQFPHVAVWLDGLNVVLSIFIILYGRHILWLIITFLVIFYAMMELTEMVALDFRYFKELSNFVDITIITLVLILLYLPQKYIWNPQYFSTNNSDPSYEERNCKVKRSISALVIVLAWLRILTSFAKLPGLKHCNFYLIMFYKVMLRYAKIMLWYGLYLVAFGIGFYIMLHDDTGHQNLKETNDDIGIQDVTSNSDTEKREKTKFDNPYLAQIKTSAMFVGEFDFDSIPIRGGDISDTMAYIYLLAFIFLMVVVLLNLLNGLAVSDTGKMIQDSFIESQASFIKNIRYFESVYFDPGQMQCIGFTKKMESRINSFFQIRIIPRKMLLFQSPYLSDKKLTLPLKEGEKHVSQLKKKLEKTPFKGMVDWLLEGHNSWNYESTKFLIEARAILCTLKKSKMDEIRREDSIKKKVAMEMKKDIPIEDKARHLVSFFRRLYSQEA